MQFLREVVFRVDSTLCVDLEDQGLYFVQFAFRWINCILMLKLSFVVIVKRVGQLSCSGGCINCLSCVCMRSVTGVIQRSVSGDGVHGPRYNFSECSDPAVDRQEHGHNLEPALHVLSYLRLRANSENNRRPRPSDAPRQAGAGQRDGKALLAPRRMRDVAGSSAHTNSHADTRTGEEEISAFRAAAAVKGDGARSAGAA